ncbi:MAG: ZIP family metal transporter [Planctomycetota bacterium]|nr:MAG: ZIP family metal transporter [Planctomycetota bacterium]
MDGWTVWLSTCLSLVCMSAISLVGFIAVGWKRKETFKVAQLLMAMAAGTLLGNAILHLWPEGREHFETSLEFSLWVMGGILFFFLVEGQLHCRSCQRQERTSVSALACLNLIGDGIHNFMDGVLIAASYSVDFHLGLATTVAIAFHEIPQEIGDIGILLYAGLSLKRALAWNLLCSFSAFGGALLFFLLPYTQQLSSVLLPLSAGSFLYLALSHLVPEMHKENNSKTYLTQLFFMLLGIALMVFFALARGNHF